jgi:hypothetical protein
MIKEGKCTFGQIQRLLPVPFGLELTALDPEEVMATQCKFDLCLKHGEHKSVRFL